MRRLRAASVLPGDSEFTLERKLLRLLVYIYPTHDRTRFKFWKPVRCSPTVGGKVRLRLSAQTRRSLFSEWIKSFYISTCLKHSFPPLALVFVNKSQGMGSVVVTDWRFWVPAASPLSITQITSGCCSGRSLKNFTLMCYSWWHQLL